MSWAPPTESDASTISMTTPRQSTGLPAQVRWPFGETLEKKWAALGWERSPLGYPTTDELGTPDGVGRFNHFAGGSIYWTPSTGAAAVWGDIRSKWASLGWEQSYLGYPTSDESDFPEGGRANSFQHGGVYWWPDTGPIDLRDVVLHYTGFTALGKPIGIKGPVLTSLT